MGGKTAMVAALHNPELVAALLIGDMAPARTCHGQGKLGEAMLRLSFPAHLERKDADALLRHDIPRQDMRDLMIQNIRLGDNPGWAIGMSEIVESMGNIENWPYVPEGHVYDGPTLFLRGSESPYIGPEHEPVMARLFPMHRLETIQGVGHWLHAENPKRFSELMTTFLANV